MLSPCLNGKVQGDFEEEFKKTIEALSMTFRMHHSMMSEFSAAFDSACPGEKKTSEEWVCSESVNDIVYLCYAIAIFNTTVTPFQLEFKPGVAIRSMIEKDSDSNNLSLIDSLAEPDTEAIAFKCLLDIVQANDKKSCNSTSRLYMSYWIANMNLVYKAYKQKIAPTSLIAHEKSELLNANKIIQLLDSDYDYNVKSNSIYNSDATVLACRFGDTDMSTVCNLFSNMFMHSGIGYTFNNEPFWNLLRNTTTNHAFFSEFYERTTDIDGLLPRTIQNTGKEFSLDFIIRHSPYGYNIPEKVGYPEKHPEIFLSLHDPADIGSSSSGAVAILPGMIYDIKVYPTVTITDDTALTLEPKVRNCQKREENDNLVAYKAYSQSACLFECRIKIALEKCNCSSIEFPRMNTQSPICLETTSIKCFHDVVESEELDDQCNCLNDCTSISYNVDVHVTKLQLTNSKDLV